MIEGKGQGLIILLHGAPGTGKTLTAESVAELAEKPLYRVTCGDIGTDAESVERYLETVSHIGATWDCVVLLDEADVFLEERTQMDLQRNALISVFLRVLEYYEGILILTTNRVGTFDGAFKSRVQLAMFYPRLDINGRRKVWNNFIQQLKDSMDTVNFDQLESNLVELAQPVLNGRQIRNVTKTARQLAHHQRKPLAFGHFERAIKIATDFEDYVKQIHGHDDDEWAREQRIRS
ncbi:hypothetical protein H2203_005431 [Taxawa tesnikishii (nom. ined.)]|nr:hypothetical protein H2203_005431 [Dothideales sp. JES 119]